VLIAHIDRGSPYAGLLHTYRLAEFGAAASLGDAFNNATVESLVAVPVPFVVPRRTLDSGWSLPGATPAPPKILSDHRRAMSLGDLPPRHQEIECSLPSLVIRS
jgi:hypothetical protein